MQVLILGWLFPAPSGFLTAILLNVMMRIPHPEPLTRRRSTQRKVIAITLLIFILLRSVSADQLGTTDVY